MSAPHVTDGNTSTGEPRADSARFSALLDQTRALAEVFQQEAAQADRQGTLSAAGVQALKSSGYSALTVPARLGGQGATLHEFATVQELLGQADASLALVAAMNAHLLGSIGEAGTGEAGGWPEALYAELAHSSVQRGALSNSLASEPDLGSPSRGGLPKTVAEQVDGGWRLTGLKTWSTGSAALDYFVVTAAANGAEVWRFVIPADSEGVSVLPTWQGSLGLRGSGSDDVQLDSTVSSCRTAAPCHLQRPAAPQRRPAAAAGSGLPWPPPIWAWGRRPWTPL